MSVGMQMIIVNYTFIIEHHMDCWCCKSMGICYDVFVYLSMCDAVHLQ